jgi:hypothetical protein
MFRAFLTGMVSAIVVMAGVMPPHASAQAGPNLRLLSQQTLESSQQVKVPDVNVGGRTVLVTGNRNSQDAHVWRKADADLNFGGPQRLGEPGDNTLFNNVAVGALPDGSAYTAWFGPSEAPGISGRRVEANGTLGPTEDIMPAGRNFRAYLDVAATADGTVVVAWSENSTFFFRYRSPATQNRWVGPNAISDQKSQNIPMLTTGPNNRIGIAFGNAEGEIFAGQWNGQGFTIERVTNNDDFDADPSIALLPNGTPIVAWRRVDRGFYFAQRQANGSWPNARLSNIDVFGIAAVSADEAGNVAFSWAGTDARLYVAYQTAGNVFDGPRVLTPSGAAYFISRNAANINNQSLIHVTVERHSGRNLNTDYTLWAATGAGNIGAKPAVENDAPTAGNKTTVSVNFNNVAGSPTQVRWRWGAAPTDAASDSNGWVAFANPLSVPIPSSVNTTDCTPETLYTQVRNATITENAVEADSITIDNQVSTAARISNPFIASKSPAFTPLPQVGLDDANSDGGAADGDPDYTREPFFYLEVNGTNDCTGLSEFAYGASAQTLSRPFGVVNNFFANTLAFPSPSDLTQGPRTVLVRVKDKAGNQIDFTRTLTYDSVRPVVAAGAQLAITPNARATILADLALSNLQVTDAYPGGYWGAWVANSLTPVADPTTSTALNWTPVQINGPARSAGAATIKNWSLATKLGVGARSIPANSTIYVYVRLLDGAGNPSDRVITQQVTLPAATLPQTQLPLVRR